MPNTTNVPQPIFGDNGFVAPDEVDVLAGVQTDINGAFNNKLNFSTSIGSRTNPTPQGQLASSETALIGDSNAMFLWFVSQVDPAFSSGRMQDGIARIYFITRIPSSATIVQCDCTGLQNVTIDVGSLAQGDDNNLYICQVGGTIPASGVIQLPFANIKAGPLPPPSALTIYQAVSGWDTITPVSSILGANVESRQQFEERRRISTAINSQGMIPSVLGAVLAVPGVLDAFVTENVEDTIQTVGGVALLPHSLYVCALGGNQQDVAAAIWSRKAPGCQYTGNITINVQDPSPQYTPPVPTYAVKYQTPTIVDFAIQVVLKNNALIPSDARTQIQDVIINAFAGLDGGLRAKIGSTVFASRYYGGVAALGSWAQIVDIKVGINNAASTFTGFIGGTTLTVTAMTSGTIAAGQLLQDLAGNMVSGTTILNQISGTTGGAGAYNVSTAQTLGSGVIMGTTLLDSYTLNINQAPAVSANHIQVQLT